MHGWLGRRSKLVRAIVIALALLFILLEWITRVLAGSIQFLIRLIGLTRFENWLRGLPLWCVAPLTIIVFIGYAGLEFGQFVCLGRHLYLLALVFHLLKWAIFPVLSYIWRLYDERLLKYAWIRWTYNLIMYVHNLVVDWMHDQEFYKNAVEYKNRVKENLKITTKNLIIAFRLWRKRRSNGSISVAKRYLRRSRR